MAKTREQKVEIVNTLGEGFKAAKLIVLSEIKGLNVSDTTKLRNILRKEKVSHMVAKISLIQRALNRAGIKVDKLKVTTQAAVTYSEDDTAAARILKKFSRENDKLKLLAGYLDKSYLDQAQLTQLASIPSRVDLLGQLVGVIAGPQRSLVTVLSGSHRGLVQALSQIKKA